MPLVHILRDGSVLVPPFPEPQIPALLHAGAVRPSDHYWHEGMTEWMPVPARWRLPAESPPVQVPVAVRHAPEVPAAPVPAPVPAAEPPVKLSRWERGSKLQRSETRYRDTCAPWQEAIGIR